LPRTREQIKHDPVASDTWRPQRTQAGGLWFDPLKIRPMTDHVQSATLVCYTLKSDPDGDE